MDTKRRSVGINFLGWGILAANFGVFIVYYLPSTVDLYYRAPKIINLIATLAVFPLDFYTSYLSGLWLAQLAWIFVMMLCAFGILLLNRFARDVFIVLNIIHIVILSFIVLMKLSLGYKIFIDYFFKLYFSLVASGTYVGFLTIPEVREEFKMDLERMKIQFWFLKTNLQKTSRNDPNGFYNLGLAYDKLGRYDDAVAEMLKAVAIDPENDQYRFHVGYSFFKQKKYSEAIEAFKEAIRLNPVCTEAYYHLGQIYRLQGCSEEAARILETASHTQPDNAEIYKNLGEAYLSQGRFDEAVRAFGRAGELDPTCEHVFYQIGKILMKRDDKKEDALQALKKAVNLQPELTDAHFSLGLLALESGRYKEAVRSFREVINREENNARAHYQLGFAYVMLGDTESAQRQVRTLKDLDPDLAENLRMAINRG